MAADPHDGDFFLPSQFLTDNDIISENQSINHKGSPETRTPFTWEISQGFGSCGSSSALSSPVESDMGSTRTESEEEDYIAELTRQMYFYMLQEDDKHTVPTIASENTKSRGSADSPQSTLWSALGSNHGSPLPATPINGKGDTWDLLSGTAEKFQTMKLNEEGPRFHHGQILSSIPLEPTQDLSDVKKKNPNVSTQSNQTLTHGQLRAIQFYQLKQRQIMKQQLQHMQNRGRACGGFGNGRAERNSRPLGLSSSAWPPLQHQQKQNQQTGSGMRAIFLTGSSSRSGSSGTGVFLPPGLLNSSESRKKPGCSTVLIPAKVVQALNLHFDNMVSLSPYSAGGFPLQHEEASMGESSGALFSQQKRHSRNLAGMKHHEMGLPQEWTN